VFIRIGIVGFRFFLNLLWNFSRKISSLELVLSVSSMELTAVLPIGIFALLFFTVIAEDDFGRQDDMVSVDGSQPPRNQTVPYDATVKGEKSKVDSLRRLKNLERMALDEKPKKRALVPWADTVGLWGDKAVKMYKGFRVGCYAKFCIRWKWKDYVNGLKWKWSWIEAWDYKPGGKKSQKVPCKNNQYCLDYVKQRPGDFPCYVSKWSEYPCYKGRRFGCSPPEKTFYPDPCCWHETLKAPHYWDWAHVGKTGDLLLCGEHWGWCKIAAREEIDKLGEI